MIAVAVVAALAVFTQVGAAGSSGRIRRPAASSRSKAAGFIWSNWVTPEAPPVVLLHGAGTNLSDMRLALGERLAATHRVILIDRPGHGWSERPGGAADASPGRQAMLVHQALAQIGVSRPILVAHSWAGALATAYALACPDGVAGLVLLAPVTRPWVNSVAWHDSFVKAILAEGTRGCRGAAARVIGCEHAVAAARQSPDGAERAERVRAAGAAAGLSCPDGRRIAVAAVGVHRQCPGHRTARCRHRTAQAQNYRLIETPTVIITGDRDATLSPDAQAEAIAAAMPRAKLVVVPGVGHMVHFAASERIVEAIAEMNNGGERGAPHARPQCAYAAPSSRT